MRTTVAVAIAIAGALVGCQRSTSLYCDENDPTCPAGYYCETGTRVCIELVDGAVIPCDQTHPCHEPLPFCLDNVCVECGGDPDCNDNDFPRCDTDLNVCAGCLDDNDCDMRSGVCQEDGHCADESRILYTDPDAGITTCTRADPCDLVHAVNTVLGTDARDIVFLAPGQHDIGVALDPQVDVTFIGRGAEIRYTGGDDNVMEIDGTTGDPTITMYYVELTGGSGAFPQGGGIRCDGQSTLALHGVSIHGNDEAGINILDCTVQVTDSTIYDNDQGGITLQRGSAQVSDSTIRANNNAPGVTATMGSFTIRRSIIRVNPFGGLNLVGGGPHTVENCLIIGNGSGSGPTGGAYFGPGGGHVFRFNTVAGNSNDTAAQDDGLSCTSFTGSSNLFDDPVLSLCTQSFSLFTDNAGPAPNGGTNNLEGVASPMFVTTDPAMPGYYHIQPTSMAVNAGDQASPPADDIDKERRPSTSNPGPDIGADEVQ